MHARLTLVPAGPGMRPAMERVADELAPLIRAQPGFAEVTYLLDDTGDAAGLYGALSLWRTRRDAEAAARVLDARVREVVAGVGAGSPTIRLFTTYEPKS
jgi:heme-degrading monooxygenase HmoA